MRPPSLVPVSCSSIFSSLQPVRCHLLEAGIMEERILAEVRARLQAGGEGLARLLAELRASFPAVLPVLPYSVPGGRRSARQSRRRIGLAPLLLQLPPRRHSSRSRRGAVAVDQPGAGGGVATPPPCHDSTPPCSGRARSSAELCAPAARAPLGTVRSTARAPVLRPSRMGHNISSGTQSSDGGAPPTPPVSRVPGGGPSCRGPCRLCHHCYAGCRFGHASASAAS